MTRPLRITEANRERTIGWVLAAAANGTLAFWADPFGDDDRDVATIDDDPFSYDVLPVVRTLVAEGVLVLPEVEEIAAARDLGYWGVAIGIRGGVSA